MQITKTARLKFEQDASSAGPGFDRVSVTAQVSIDQETLTRFEPNAIGPQRELGIKEDVPVTSLGRWCAAIGFSRRGALRAR